MNGNANTKFAALVLPLALFALLQGGSCKSGGAANANASNADARSTSMTNTNASNAAANRGGGGEARANAGGRRVGGVTSPTTNQSDGDIEAGGVAKGIWGGDHVRLEVKDGGAEVEFDCAHGSMGKIATDAQGNFNVSGVFVPESGGPVTPESGNDERPARYSGRVEGRRMTLKLRLANSDEDLGTFTLSHGNEGNLTKCL